MTDWAIKYVVAPAACSALVGWLFRMVFPTGMVVRYVTAGIWGVALVVVVVVTVVDMLKAPGSRTVTR